jgi:hypothetical protein
MATPRPAAFRLGSEGSAALQFALVAPALVLLLAGCFEIAVLLFVSGSLESAVLAASRYGTTGSVDGGVTREERIRQIIAERTLGLVDPKLTEIHTLVYPSFANIGQPEPFTDSNHNGVRDTGEGFTDVNGNGHWDADMGVAGLGGPGDIVLYDVTFETGAITHLLQPVIGRITHRATVAVRNEPY